MNGIKKLQLITLHGTKNGNYGSIIQSQAIFQFLNRFYDVQYAMLTDKNEIMNSDLAVWGGDQVFNEDIFKTLLIDIYKMTRHLKYVIFSASFGNASIGQNMKAFLNFVKQSKNIACATREINDYAQQLFKSNHFTVIDPALMKSRDDWLSCIGNDAASKDYTFGYAPCNSREKCAIYEDLGKKLGIDINEVIYTGSTSNGNGIACTNEFLSLIKNAKTVYTKSFHCFLFSVLFNKQIKFYDDEFKSNKRISSFIDKYRIEFDLDGNMQNYDDVIKRIDDDRRKSMTYLYDSVFYRIEAYVAQALFGSIKCSSGGMSMAFAYEIIKNGGCVYGVAWKNAWEAEYICIDKIDDYCKIAGSKYIYAAPPDFKEIKQKLDAGKLVMLVGLPCLIRAFQRYIFFKFYSNLVLVDLLCSGGV